MPTSAPFEMGIALLNLEQSLGLGVVSQNIWAKNISII
jgi:hypothetical protein